ncbi:MAG: helix-turn-helix domain-containing protein [Saprospiraceae bacterium]|nr:helix-turn-helix domain-containing protein [Saprospiraceae bacterium]
MKPFPVRKINVPQDGSKPSISFGIRDVKDILAGKDTLHEFHRHEYFFILALKKGKGLHTIDFTPYKVVNHSVFFIRPGQVHELMLKSESTGYLMEFKNDFYDACDKMSSQLLRSASSMNLCMPDADRFRRLLTLLAFIYAEFTDKKEGHQEVIRANLSIFFIELARHRQQRSAANNVSQYMQERLDRFTELLETHVATHKEVSHYADMLHLSTYQLNAITKAALGKTVSELIDEYIILESKRYLLATSNLVNQVAFLLGYEDVSYFIRFFKKHTGHTPVVFRRNFG